MLSPVLLLLPRENTSTKSLFQLLEKIQDIDLCSRLIKSIVLRNLESCEFVAKPQSTFFDDPTIHNIRKDAEYDARHSNMSNFYECRAPQHTEKSSISKIRPYLKQSLDMKSHHGYCCSEFAHTLVEEAVQSCDCEKYSTLGRNRSAIIEKNKENSFGGTINCIGYYGCENMNGMCQPVQKKEKQFNSSDLGVTVVCDCSGGRIDIDSTLISRVKIEEMDTSINRDIYSVLMDIVNTVDSEILLVPQTEDKMESSTYVPQYYDDELEYSDDVFVDGIDNLRNMNRTHLVETDSDQCTFFSLNSQSGIEDDFDLENLIALIEEQQTNEVNTLGGNVSSEMRMNPVLNKKNRQYFPNVTRSDKSELILKLPLPASNIIDRKLNQFHRICKLCKIRNNGISVLIGHLMSHISISPKIYSCTWCYFKTNYLHNIRRHIKALHKRSTITRHSHYRENWSDSTMSSLLNAASRCYPGSEKIVEYFLRRTQQESNKTLCIWQKKLIQPYSTPTFT